MFLPHHIECGHFNSWDTDLQQGEGGEQVGSGLGAGRGVDGRKNLPLPESHSLMQQLIQVGNSWPFPLFSFHCLLEAFTWTVLCWMYFSVQPRFHREWKREAELRIGNLINPICTEYMLFQKVYWSLVWHCTGQLKIVVPIIIFCNRKA